MAGGNQQSLIERLRPVISSDRLGTYLQAAGFDGERALELYVWNASVGESFHLPIQAVEIGLRNRINNALTAQFGLDWWRAESFIHVLHTKQAEDLTQAKKRIANKKAKLVTGQIVATLSFGFWVGLLQPHYNPEIWSHQLRGAFPDLPAHRSRYDLAESARRTADLRNRIWHHEPIIHMDILSEFGLVMELLTWICATKAAWIRPQCRVASLVRQKP